MDTVGKKTRKIKKYIQNKLKEDREIDQLAMYFDDPFKGFKIEKKKQGGDK